MVHISDHILAWELWLSAWGITVVILAYTLKKMKIDDVPKLSVITAAVFIASLIKLPAGPTSVHLILNGFAGVTLGILAYPCIFIAIVMQYFLFSHGGVSTIGINTVNMGVPALISFLLFRTGMKLNIEIKRKKVIIGAIAVGIAVALVILLSKVELLISGKEYTDVTQFFIITHILMILIVSYLIYRTGIKRGVEIRKEVLIGAIAGGIAVALAVLLLAVELLITGEELTKVDFTEVTTAIVFAHIPVILFEAIFTGVIAGFLATVKPEMLSIEKMKK